MNSSGIKRGLAATAVSALAVAGLPLLASSASATPLTGTGDSINLVSQVNDGAVSSRDDRTNKSISLTATAGASVASVKFEYSLNGGATWTAIDTVSSRHHGTFTTEWAPDKAIDTLRVTLRVTAYNAAGASLGSSERTNVQVNPGASTHTVELSDGELGVFQQPYGVLRNAHTVAITGTSSAETGRVLVNAENNGGSTVGQVGVDLAKGAFAATLNLNNDTRSTDPYRYSDWSTTANELLVTATAPSGGTTDTEAFALYKQEIAEVLVTPVSAKVAAGNEARITVTVLDQKGKPISGARVNRDGASILSERFTGADGTVTFNQGVGEAARYYADATDNRGYSETAGDKISEAVTVTEYTPRPDSLFGASADGAVLDLDEWTGNEISVQVRDQENADLNTSGQQLQYVWKFTPFRGAAVADVSGTVTTESGGKFTVPKPAGNVEGTYELLAALTADARGNGAIPSRSVLTFKAGQAELVYDAAPEHAPAGTAVTYTGKLQLKDSGGAGLAGRSVTFNSTAGTAGTDAVKDAALVGANGAPVSSLGVTTAADGGFAVTVKDPAETPQGSEIDVKLAATVNSSTYGNTNASAPAVRDLDFTIDEVPAKAALTINDVVGSKPGVESSTGTVTVMYAKDADGRVDDPVAGQLVTLTVDHGYFSNGVATPTVKDGLQGQFKNLGREIIVRTDASGRADFKTAIGRDEGFDDDGKVTAVVTAKAGALSKTDAVEWNSANPLNGGAVDLVVSAASAQVNPINPTRRGNEIWYDVRVTDQFGNRVAGERVNVSATRPDGRGNTVPVQDVVRVTSNLTELGDLKVSSAAAAEVDVTATWATQSNTFSDTSGTTARGSKTFTDAEKASFYAVDFAKSSFELSSSAAGSVAPGTTVTQSVKVVDQHGRPVNGLEVEFLRKGPDASGGDFNHRAVTNANGVATYNFVGSAEGVAEITAVVTDGLSTKTLAGEVVFDDGVDPVKFADLDFAITEAQTVLPNGLVTKSVTVKDKDGAAVSGLSVEFTVAGKSVTRVTGPDGVASYTFNAPAAEGAYDVIAVVTDGGIQSKTLTSAVVVEAEVVTPEPPVGPTKITATLAGANNGKKADKLTVRASAKAAAGAIVKLFKINAKGKRVLVDTDVLNGNGARVFTVADKNKAKKTTYVAVIDATDATTKATSKNKSVR